MARIPRNVAGNIVYHVLNRANGREQIFRKPKDYEAFIKVLFEAKEKYPMRILSFCIMPNHWHFVLYPKKEGDMPNFMRWVTHTHTQRYHAHYRSIGYGHVYQGRYKSFPTEKDEHLLQVCRYVERNPIRARLVKNAQEWKWSSAWIRENGNQEEKRLLSDWPVQQPEGYLKWVNETEENEKNKLQGIRYSIKRGCPYGKGSWIKRMAIKLNLVSTLIPRGRPKKGT
jgi:putative transposase